MNRYQAEVAEMDHRRKLIIRACSFVGVAALVVAALWGAGFPPSEWWAGVHAWLAPSAEPASETTASAQPQSTASAAFPTAIPSSTADVPSGTESSVSATPQPLFLVATSPGKNKSEGTALIGTNPDNPQTYVGGALLANGALLAEIHRDHVVLVRGDSSARLDLYKRNGSAAPARDPLLMVGGAREPQAPIAVTREVLTDYLRPSPVFDGEMLRGYEVYAGPKAGVFSRLGLQAGDVIIAIDDAPLNDAQQAMELFAQLARGNAVVATVERKNVKHRITLDGALITADQEQARNAATQPVSPLMPQT